MSPSLYLSVVLSVSNLETLNNAPDDRPFMSSPLKNPVVVVPIPMLPTLRTPVSKSQLLTLACVPDLKPCTTSLNKYVPIPLIVSGFEIVTVGADVYAAPAFVMNIELTRLNPLEGSTPIDAIPVALSAATPAFGTATVTIGAVPNPTPLSVIVNLTTPFVDVLIEQVAAAPVPPPPENVIVGGDV